MSKLSVFFGVGLLVLCLQLNGAISAPFDASAAYEAYQKQVEEFKAKAQDYYQHLTQVAKEDIQKTKDYYNSAYQAFVQKYAPQSPVAPAPAPPAPAPAPRVAANSDAESREERDLKSAYEDIQKAFSHAGEDAKEAGQKAYAYLKELSEKAKEDIQNASNQIKTYYSNAYQQYVNQHNPNATTTTTAAGDF